MKDIKSHAGWHKKVVPTDMKRGVNSCQLTQINRLQFVTIKKYFQNVKKDWSLLDKQIAPPQTNTIGWISVLLLGLNFVFEMLEFSQNI